ncbi:MAG TPA: c-type cytochrome [Oceanospirillales bacterium]|nr:c-type cytochrome [Oceanospirillales bacterium]
MKNLIKTYIKSISILTFLIATMTTVVNAETYPQAGDFTKGAKTWADNCSRCHNMRDPKDLRDDQWITTAFHMRIRAGLTGQQTRDILTFLQQSNNNTVEVANVEEGNASQKVVSSGLTGEQIYTQTCIACHGGNGAGMVPGAPNFGSKDSPLQKSDAELIKNISNGFQTPGSPMAMPAKGGNAQLNAEDIRLVLAYIRSNFDK